MVAKNVSLFLESGLLRSVAKGWSDKYLHNQLKYSYFQSSGECINFSTEHVLSVVTISTGFSGGV